jgi:hypothetical protein
VPVTECSGEPGPPRQFVVTNMGASPVTWTAEVSAGFTIVDAGATTLDPDASASVWVSTPALPSAPTSVPPDVPGTLTITTALAQPCPSQDVQAFPMVNAFNGCFVGTIQPIDFGDVSIDGGGFAQTRVNYPGVQCAYPNNAVWTGSSFRLGMTLLAVVGPSPGSSPFFEVDAPSFSTALWSIFFDSTLASPPPVGPAPLGPQSATFIIAIDYGPVEGPSVEFPEGVPPVCDPSALSFQVSGVFVP